MAILFGDARGHGVRPLPLLIQQSYIRHTVTYPFGYGMRPKIIASTPRWTRSRWTGRPWLVPPQGCAVGEVGKMGELIHQNGFPPSTNFFLTAIDLLASTQVKRGNYNHHVL